MNTTTNVYIFKNSFPGSCLTIPLNSRERSVTSASLVERPEVSASASMCMGSEFITSNSFRSNNVSSGGGASGRRDFFRIGRSCNSSSARTSSTDETSFALPSRMSLFGPSLRFSVMFPGTAKTSRFWSSAVVAVIIAPPS